MDIHIGNLPPAATISDLSDFLGLSVDAGKCRVFEKQGRDGRVFHFGMATIRSNFSARLLITRFNKTLFNGQRLEVREIQPRRIGNERRALDWRTKDWNGTSRRINERRIAK